MDPRTKFTRIRLLCLLPRLKVTNTLYCPAESTYLTVRVKACSRNDNPQMPCRYRLYITSQGTGVGARKKCLSTSADPRFDKIIVGKTDVTVA